MGYPCRGGYVVQWLQCQAGILATRVSILAQAWSSLGDSGPAAAPPLSLPCRAVGSRRGGEAVHVGQEPSRLVEAGAALRLTAGPERWAQAPFYTVIGPLMLLISTAWWGGVSLPPTAPRRFLVQSKGECRFSNTTGQEQVRFLQWYIYDRMEFLLFDSAVGRFMAVMLLGEPIATDWNKKVLQDRRAGVDRCRGASFSVPQFLPEVTISPTKDDPLSPRSLLLCTTASFYPGEIEVRWLKNGRRATEGVFYGEELHNGDWTYQTQVMLEDTPQRGDVYACQVEHASLQTPITVQWEPRTSTSARIKLWTGVVGALLGMVFVAMGLSCYLRSKKGKGGIGVHLRNLGGRSSPLNAKGKFFSF
uniref:Ig-like domain-containing protein n=1 Tax=Varanus komodoensis TaxID=61221 RepID=A0A8D2L849_VARKO